jgi:hypothetical protein
MPIKRRPPQALVLKENPHAASELARPCLHAGRGARRVALRRLEVGTFPALTIETNARMMRAFTLSRDALTARAAAHS